MAVIKNAKLVMFLYLLFISFALTTSDDADDVRTLHAFRDSILDPLGSLSSWNSNIGPCIKPLWIGIKCQAGQVFGIQLEGMGLSGRLDLDVLTPLPLLRTLSFMNNNFSGPLPDLKKFQGLKNVFFAMNQFEGEIPDDAFDGMQSLKKVNLSMIGFTGRIPSSLTRVNSLSGLWLNDNGFVGEIPDFEQTGLVAFNVSNNHLEGRIPDKLSKLDPSNFSGNKDLCGQPTKLQCEDSADPDHPPSSTQHKNLSTSKIAAIAAAIGLVLFIFVAVLILLRNKKNSGKNKKMPRATSLPHNPTTVETDQNLDRKGKKPMAVANERDHGKLVFLNEERTEVFELQDLLKASAEVLGGAELGSSYKALLINGPAVVVKRYKEMDRVGREDFHEYMKTIGRLSHPNLLPILAYHSRKDEKLLVTEFVPYGSLANMLHGNRTVDNPALDWGTRLKIVKGITKGLSYLYEELSTENAPHGHLKSSNVLLSDSFEPLLTDYGLIPLISQSHASEKMIAFKSPECKQNGRLSKKSDVWSLGVLILELLTGKYPGNYTRNARGGSDLSNWVNSVVREEWTGEVFDGEMRRTRSSEGEMLSLLQIGMGCCEMDVNKRWDMRDAAEKIAELKETDVEDEYSSLASEGDGYSSRGGVTEDDFSFSTNNP